MKIALAGLPWPFLVETRIVARAANGHWHDLHSVLAEIGLSGVSATSHLPATLAFLASLGTSTRHKIERALDARKNGTPNPALLKPMDPLTLTDVVAELITHEQT